jgi:hypothetical protein
MGLAWGGAIALTVALSGVVAAATVLSALSTPPAPTAPVVDTSKTFEDLDGNGIDDDCQTGPIVADPVAAAAAEAAADLNGDGTISVSEAAQSDRTGGTNCNHGGYVSGVAHASCTDATAPANTTTDPTAGTGTTDSDAEDGDSAADTGTTEATEPTDASVSGTTCSDTTTDTTTTPTTCAPAPAGGTTDGTTTDGTTTDGTTTPTDTSPNAHGKAVAAVAQSDAVGGKNCNHGGAVSEVAKNHDARDAAKAAREAAREARRAEREAARAAKHHGRPG